MLPTDSSLSFLQQAMDEGILAILLLPTDNEDKFPSSSNVREEQAERKEREEKQKENDKRRGD